MTEGYLVFTTHDGDELDATLVPKEIYDKLKTADGHEEAGRIWSECQEPFIKTRKDNYFAQAPGSYEWPYNDVKILGTFYLLVY